MNKEITEFEIMEFRQKNKNLDFIEISIRTKENIKVLINKIAQYLNPSLLPQNFISEFKSSSIENTIMEKSKIEVISFILIGDTGIGKTCFIDRYFHDRFQDKSIATIGIDKYKKFIKYNNNIYKLIILDTGGVEKFKHLPKKYYPNCDGILLLFDEHKCRKF